MIFLVFCEFTIYLKIDMITVSARFFEFQIKKRILREQSEIKRKILYIYQINGNSRFDKWNNFKQV